MAFEARALLLPLLIRYPFGFFGWSTYASQP